METGGCSENMVAVLFWHPEMGSRVGYGCYDKNSSHSIYPLYTLCGMGQAT